MKADKVFHRNGKIPQIGDEIPTVYYTYLSLEARTEVIVCRIQSFAEDLQSTAEDTAEDFNWAHFNEEVAEDLSEVKAALEEVSEKHANLIRCELVLKKPDLEKRSHIFGEKKKRIAETFTFEDGEEDYYTYTFALWSSVPIYGQIVTLLAGGYVAGSIAANRVEEIDLPEYVSVPFKVIAGSVAAVGGGLGFAVVSILHLPVAPLLWAHYAYKSRRLQRISTLADRYCIIELQMEHFELHLASIRECLSDIEQRLHMTIKAKSNVMDASNSSNRQKFVERARKRSIELVVSCKKYLELKSKFLTYFHE